MTAQREASRPRGPSKKSAPPVSDDPVGGRYELAEPIGEGNFSITYRGRDTTLGRAVAIKMLRPQYAADKTFVSRFEREAASPPPSLTPTSSTSTTTASTGTRSTSSCSSWPAMIFGMS